MTMKKVEVEAELSKMLFDEPYLNLNEPKNRARLGLLVSVLLANEKERLEALYINRN